MSKDAYMTSIIGMFRSEKAFFVPIRIFLNSGFAFVCGCRITLHPHTIDFFVLRRVASILPVFPAAQREAARQINDP
ncbi:hypothetical protein SDC9_136938 [bioreactor metagenome]|uniref:Uncharacterized protein n=1 Tax=bioreactor metagenome TaxID=1076179 RepID=A0A645DM13_9ZZZZ